MKRFWGMTLATALAMSSLTAAPVIAATGSSGAKSACNDRIRRDYDASTRSVSTNDRGNDRYDVRGEAHRGGETASFTCRTNRGYVDYVDVGSWRKSSGGGGDAVAAVGIAVGLAAIIAAASSKKKNDQYDRYGQQNYYDQNNGYGGGYGGNGYADNDSFSPGGGVTCYRAQRACFDSYNNYNARWTQREFNY